MTRTLPTLALLALLSAPARAERPYLDIGGADFKPLPIALENFTGATEAEKLAAQELNDVLGADLESSGLFDVLDPRSFLRNAAKDGFTVPSIDFVSWSNVGAQALVKAQLRAGGAGVTAELKLFSVPTASEDLHRTYDAPRDNLRSIAHRFADDLQKLFTGERGVFQTSIVFVRKNGPNKELVVADFDGQRPRVVVAGDTINMLPSWSPDGRSLAFTSWRNGPPVLYRVGLDGLKIEPFARKGNLTSGAAWSPDGAYVAFTADVEGNADIYRMKSDGSDLRKLTDFWGMDMSPSWAPDGKRIAFVSSRSGAPQIYVMNADGSAPERMTYQGNYNQTPDWSPRGDMIAFTARDEKLVFDLFLVEVATKRIIRLTQGEGTNNEEPSFSPDGRQIAFASNRDGVSQIYAMLADGSAARRLTSSKTPCTTPAWGPWLP